MQPDLIGDDDDEYVTLCFETCAMFCRRKMHATTTPTSTSNRLTAVSLESTLLTTNDDRDPNISITTSPWPGTACVVLASLNTTGGGGGCRLDEITRLNSTPPPVAQCAVFVQPWALLLLAFPLMTVFGNVLVCLSVYRERNLRTATNFFIVSLAISDLMVAVLVMPLAVYVEVSQSISNV